MKGGIFLSTESSYVIGFIVDANKLDDFIHSIDSSYEIWDCEFCDYRLIVKTNNNRTYILPVVEFLYNNNNKQNYLPSYDASYVFRLMELGFLGIPSSGRVRILFASDGCGDFKINETEYDAVSFRGESIKQYF